MKVYSIKFGLNSGDHNLALDKIKNAGYEVIQVSDGLLIKAVDLGKVQSELSGFAIQELDLEDPDLSKDAKVFAGVI